MKHSIPKYGVSLTVKKVSVIFFGNIRYPFCCDILTTDDAYFRCAVNAKLLPDFLLAQENDELNLVLQKIYDASSVMGVCSCQNLTHSLQNLENDVRENITDSLVLDVNQTFVLPMSFVLNNGSAIMQDKYYCLIADIKNRYIGFETEGKNIPLIVSSLYQDKIELKFYAVSSDDTLELIYFNNHNRFLTDLNQRLYTLCT